jgi:hypothetical protein
MAHLSNEEVRAMLPKVGDVRWERPVVADGGGHILAGKPRKCTVVYVHEEHRWYTVQFENGIKESYKMPREKLDGGDEDV